jgi:dolichyl-phosphate beta-glucosyltransferase
MNLLFADADNATDIRCLDAVLQALDTGSMLGQGFVVGSRNHHSLQTVRKVRLTQRSKLRDTLNWGFMLFVKTLCSTNLNDTQCGFKIFTRRAAQRLFPVMHLERYAFDVELIYLAKW